MIDKKKIIQFNKITIAVVLILILITTLNISLSRFQTETNGKIVGDIALYVLEAGTDSTNLKMFELDPDDQEYIYNISVQNYRGDEISEVDMEYELSVKTTTNIPVEYKLYKADNVGDNILGQKETIQDDDGMYFFKFNSTKSNFTHDVKESDDYTLIIKYPSSAKNEAYQGVIDNVEISVNSKQV